MKNNRKLVKAQIIGMFVMLVVGLFIVAGVQGAEEEKATLEYKPKADIQVQEQQVEETQDSSNLSQKNCLQSAMDYLEMGGISQKGISKQLEYEGYTISDIEYAMANLGEVDWCEQAVKCAQDYLDIPESSYSKTELIRQLQYEGFTQTEAEYGVTAVGY